MPEGLGFAFAVFATVHRSIFLHFDECCLHARSSFGPTSAKDFCLPSVEIQWKAPNADIFVGNSFCKLHC